MVSRYIKKSFVIILFPLPKFDCIAPRRWRYSQGFCSNSKMLHTDCVFSILLYHADSEYVLCLHRETLWQLSSLVLHHVIVSLYRGFIQLSIFRISRHCTTLCTLCIYVCVMNYGWCSVVSIVPQLRMSALSKRQTDTHRTWWSLHEQNLAVVFNHSWAAYTACLQTFECSWKLPLRAGACWRKVTSLLQKDRRGVFSPPVTLLNALRKISYGFG